MYAIALLPGLEAHFNLETVTVAAHLVEIDGFEHLYAEAFESAGCVSHGESGHDARVLVGEVAQQKPFHRPVDHVDALDVAGTEHEVVLLDRFEETGQRPGVVREIRIHFEHVVIALGDGVFETGDIGRAESHFLLTFEQVDAVVAAVHHRAHRVPGAVGRIVVHDEHLQALIPREDVRNDVLDVLQLVVGRYDDECALHDRTNSRVAA